MNNCRTNFILLALIISLLAILNKSSAQTTSDNQLWTGASVRLKLNKKFTITLREEIRLGDNMSSRNSTFTEIGVKYKLNKHFSFVPRFRLVNIPLKKNKKRFSFDAYYSWKKKKSPVSFKYRFRIQDTKKINSKKEANDYLRNKFTIGYNATKLVDPFFAYELYFRFDNKNEFRKNRYTFGLDWKLNKKMNLTTYYRIQKEINVKSPEKLNVIGLSFSYKFSLAKPKTVSKMN